MSSHIEIWRRGDKWHACCTTFRCAAPDDFCHDFDTHTEALAAALDHCKRYPPQPATRTEPTS